MPFFPELDDVRHEVRRGASGVVRLWPKVDGANVLADEDSVSAEAFEPGGTSLGPLTVVDGTQPEEPEEGEEEVSRFTAGVNAAELELGEGYRIDFTYQVDGVEHVESVPFDVVLEPWGTLGASYSDILDEHAALGEWLDRQAREQGEGETRERQAQRMLQGALREVRARMRRKVLESGGSWPAYIPDREGLRGVLVATAVVRVLQAQGLVSDVLINLHTFWRGEVERRWAELSPLKYGETTKSGEGELKGFAIVRQRRTWG